MSKVGLACETQGALKLIEQYAKDWSGFWPVRAVLQQNVKSLRLNRANRETERFVVSEER